MDLPKPRFSWKAATCVLAVAWVVLAVALAVGSTRAPERGEHGLSVDGIYFISAPGEESDNTIRLDVTLYLTNRSDASGDVDIVTYVIRPETNVVENRNEVEVGPIPGNRTEEVGLRIAIPTLENRYDVDFLIFEDGLLTLRGSGHIGIRRAYDRLIPSVEMNDFRVVHGGG